MSRARRKRCRAGATLRTPQVLGPRPQGAWCALRAKFSSGRVGGRSGSQYEAGLAGREQQSPQGGCCRLSRAPHVQGCRFACVVEGPAPEGSARSRDLEEGGLTLLGCLGPSAAPAPGWLCDHGQVMLSPSITFPTGDRALGTVGRHFYRGL